MKNEVAKTEKQEEYPLTVELDSKRLPAIKDWKVGGTYIIQLKVKQRSMRQGDMYSMMDGKEDKNKISGIFEVISAKSVDNAEGGRYSRDIIKKAIS